MQNFLKSAMILGLCITQVSLISAADKEVTEKVYHETNGNWQLAKSIKDGVSAPVEDLNIRMELKNGTWTVQTGDIIVSQGTYNILSLKDGYRIVSSKTTLGENKGKTGKHLSKSKGDTLTICHPPEGQDVPTEFTSDKDSGNWLRVWKRTQK